VGRYVHGVLAPSPQTKVYRSLAGSARKIVDGVGQRQRGTGVLWQRCVAGFQIRLSSHAAETADLEELIGLNCRHMNRFEFF
jgi:hypothetical protein